MGPNRTLAGGLLNRRALVIAMMIVATLLSGCSTPPNQVTGLITAVDGDLTGVTAFEMLAKGRTWRFEPAPDGDFAFPLVHLRDHLRAGDPIVVDYSDFGGALLAIRITDG